MLIHNHIAWLERLLLNIRRKTFWLWFQMFYGPNLCFIDAKLLLTSRIYRHCGKYFSMKFFRAFYFCMRILMCEKLFQEFLPAPSIDCVVVFKNFGKIDLRDILKRFHFWALTCYYTLTEIPSTVESFKWILVVSIMEKAFRSSESKLNPLLL